MRWQGGRRSEHVEDRRGSRPGLAPAGVGSLGIGGIVLLMAITYVMGGDPLAILTSTDQPSTAPAGAVTSDPPANDPAAQFVSVVLADTEDTWGPLFTQDNRRYQPPRLVLFSDAVQSACGTTSSAVGPFYCPGDAQVYIDLGFFHELDRRFGAPGDFAQAYVIASRRRASAPQRGRGECTVGPPGTASGLLRGGMGIPRGQSQSARARRRRGGARCRRSDW
jgi:predicted metalloprotease